MSDLLKDRPDFNINDDDPESTYFIGKNRDINGASAYSLEKQIDIVENLRRLYIEPTTICNFACPMCARNFWNEKIYKHMEWSVYKKIIDSAKTLGTVDTVFFGGFGEPLFHPNIVEMVKYAREAGFSPEMVTNGYLLSEAMICDLLDAGIKGFWVSYEGGDDSAGHSSFGADKVYRNLNNLNYIRVKRRPRDFCSINLTCVVMRDNLAKLSDIVYKAQNIRAQNVMFSHMLPYDDSAIDQVCYRRTIECDLGHKTDANMMTRVTFPYCDFDNNEINNFLGKLLMNNSPLNLGNLEVGRQRGVCPFIEKSETFVRFDGEVCPCMALLHSGPVYFFEQRREIREKSFGNVKDSSLADVWQSAEYVTFRRKVMNFSFSPCIDCGGCERRDKNEEDCMGNEHPTCGACFWATGLIRCP